MSRKKKSTIPRWKKLLVAALGTAVIGGGALAASNINYIRGEKVVTVYDGDTFGIENRQLIRLYGVNAPELENCMGQDAKKVLTSLILGKRVQLREPVADARRRVMALVYVNGVLINEVMLRAGLAEYDHVRQSQATRMNSAYEYARNNKIGIYSSTCLQIEPPDPACLIKGNVDTDKYKKIYMTPACDHYAQIIIQKHQGDAWFCTEAEAKKAGFTKSETCK